MAEINNSIHKRIDDKLYFNYDDLKVIRETKIHKNNTEENVRVYTKFFFDLLNKSCTLGSSLANRVCRVLHLPFSIFSYFTALIKKAPQTQPADYRKEYHKSQFKPILQEAADKANLINEITENQVEIFQELIDTYEREIDTHERERERAPFLTFFEGAPTLKGKELSLMRATIAEANFAIKEARVQATRKVLTKTPNRYFSRHKSQFRPVLQEVIDLAKKKKIEAKKTKRAAKKAADEFRTSFMAGMSQHDLDRESAIVRKKLEIADVCNERLKWLR